MVENFLSDDDIAALKAECADLVEKMDPMEHAAVFSTTKQVECSSDLLQQNLFKL